MFKIFIEYLGKDSQFLSYFPRHIKYFWQPDLKALHVMIKSFTMVIASTFLPTLSFTLKVGYRSKYVLYFQIHVIILKEFFHFFQKNGSNFFQL